MHFDVGEEFLTCIFQTGPKEIYHIVDEGDGSFGLFDEVDNLHISVEDLTIEEDAFNWGQGWIVYFCSIFLTICGS